MNQSSDTADVIDRFNRAFLEHDADLLDMESVEPAPDGTRYEGRDTSVRGVNLMHVRDGRVIEALGYVKSGESNISEALTQATGR